MLLTRAAPKPSPLAQALGLGNWSYEPETAAVALAPTSQTIYFTSIWLPAGVPVGNVWFNVSVAGAGTVPASIVCGLNDGTNMVAQSGELKANAKWLTPGFWKFPLAAAFTPPAAGYYRAVFLQNGAFGTTPMQLANRTVAGSGIGDLAHELWGTGGTGQTVLPANGNPLPALVMTANALWMGVGQ